MESAADRREGQDRRSRRLVIGNWKLNGSLATNARLLAALAGDDTGQCDVAVCVPFPYLAQAQAALQAGRIGWGAQDVSAHDAGAFTGEVSAQMLKEFGCRFALAGHSERRQWHGETDANVAAKAGAALAAGVTPVVCVGETLVERDAGATHAVVSRQIDAVLAKLGDAVKGIVVAYEPVWAIGTGRSATPAQAQEVHAVLRKRLAQAQGSRVPILYGGSVKGGNAAALFAEHDIDGALVGGASLEAQEFLAIAHA